MTLPRKRKPQRSGIERAPRREWPRHRRFVKSHECLVNGCDLYDAGPGAFPAKCGGVIEFAHVRSAANAGTGLRPFDWFGVPLCSIHHKWQHDHGADTFMLITGLDLWRFAKMFADRSPDLQMKEAMKVSLKESDTP